MIKKIVNWILEHPTQTLFSGIFFVGLVSLGISKLDDNFSYRIWFKQSNPKLVEFDNFEKRFGSDEVAVFVIHSPSGIFDKDSISLIHDMTTDLWQAPEIIRVDSLTNFQWVRAAGDDLLIEDLIYSDEYELTPELLKYRSYIAATNRNITNYLVNTKQDTSLIYVNLKPSLKGTPDYEHVVTALRNVVNTYEGRTDHVFYLTGNPVLNHTFKESAFADMERIVPIVLSVIIVFLGLFLRSIYSVLACLISIAFTLLMTIGFSGWFDIKMHNMTALVPQFMIAIAVADAVHIFATLRIFSSRFENKKEALRHSAEKNFIPTLLTSISTAIGFFCFLSAELPALIDMGIISGVGTCFAWIVTYLILVPLIYLLPTRLKFSTEKQIKDVNTPSPFAISYTNLLKKYRIFVLGFYTIVAGYTLFYLTKVEINSDPMKYFPKNHILNVSTDFVKEKLGSAFGIEITIDTYQKDGIKTVDFMQKVDQYQQWLEEHDYITKTISVVDILKQMNRSLNAENQAFYRIPNTQELIAQELFLYTMSLPQGLDINNRMSIDQDAIRLTAMWQQSNSNAALKSIEKFENKGKELGLNVSVTGKMPLYQSMNGLVVHSFIKSLTLAFLFISILIFVSLRSFKIGLISLIPNFFPILLGGSLLPLMGKPLDFGTVVVGSICLGIAVDDTIHFVANYQKNRQLGHDETLSVAKVMSSTIPALFFTTTILVVAFSMFILATFIPNQNFGLFIAIILSFALFSDVTLLPALLLTFTKKQKPSSR